MIRVYCASKAKHAPWWRALRAAGVPITASWIDWPANEPDAPEPTNEAWGRHWERCIDQASDASICLFVSNADERACGALIEAGAALAAGKRVYVVSPDAWTFAHHPRCRVFPTIEAAVGSIMAQVEGEKSREDAMARAARD